MGRLSQYITEQEFTNTQIRNVDNSLPEELKPNAVRLCNEILDRVRAYYNKPLMVTSGYRCPEVNKKVGGSRTSEHVNANACDFYILGVSLGRVFNDIALGNIKDKNGNPLINSIDQLIYEFGSWIHIGRRDKPRNQKLLASFNEKGKAVYSFIEKI